MLNSNLNNSGKNHANSLWWRDCLGTARSKDDETDTVAAVYYFHHPNNSSQIGKKELQYKHWWTEPFEFQLKYHVAYPAVSWTRGNYSVGPSSHSISCLAGLTFWTHATVPYFASKPGFCLARTLPRLLAWASSRKTSKLSCPDSSLGQSQSRLRLFIRSWVKWDLLGPEQNSVSLSKSFNMPVWAVPWTNKAIKLPCSPKLGMALKTCIWSSSAPIHCDDNVVKSRGLSHISRDLLLRPWISCCIPDAFWWCGERTWIKAASSFGQVRDSPLIKTLRWKNKIHAKQCMAPQFPLEPRFCEERQEGQMLKLSEQSWASSTS